MFRRKKIIEDALDSYKAAMEDAKKLRHTHPIKLGLALNFSVFYYEILGYPDIAVTHAKTAFDEALPDLDEVQEDEYADTASIMQLLRDNLTLWTSDRDMNEED